MADKRYRIEHADGRAYDVTRVAFTKLYEPEGFRIIANADGTAIEAAAPRAPRTRDRSAAAKKGAKSRAARPTAARAASRMAINSSQATGDPEPESHES